MPLNIDTDTIQRLRSVLLEQSDGHSPSTDSNTSRQAALVARIAPFIETMYLVAMADGEYSPEELASVHGAIQLLSAGLIDSAALETLLARCESAVREHGASTLLQILGGRLCVNREDRETAFSLAAATALADTRVEQAETDLLEEVAEWFGISSKRANELLGEVRPARN